MGGAAVLQVFVDDKMMHQHQFNGGDPQRNQIIDNRKVGESRIGASPILRNFGMARGKTFDVEFVNQGLVPGSTERLVVPQLNDGPITTHFGTPEALSLVAAEIRVRMSDSISEQRVTPFDNSRDRFDIWI
jgi:hypothetical protein